MSATVFPLTELASLISSPIFFWPLFHCCLLVMIHSFGLGLWWVTNPRNWIWSLCQYLFCLTATLATCSFIFKNNMWMSFINVINYIWLKHISVMFIFITIRKYVHKMVTFVMGLFSICLQVSFTCCVIKQHTLLCTSSVLDISVSRVEMTVGQLCQV